MKVKKIIPMNNRVLTTCDIYNEPVVNEDGIIESKEVGTIKEFQTVIACGPMARNVKPGDVVSIDPTRYQVLKHREGSLKDGVITDNPVISYNFPILEVDSKPCMYIYDSDIEFIVEEFDETSEE